MMTTRVRTLMGIEWNGLLLDVSKEAALYGLHCQTGISPLVEQWIRGPEDGDVEEAIMRFGTLIRSIARGPAGGAVAEGREAVFEMNMLWLEPNAPSETFEFLIVCCKTEEGEQRVAILHREEMTRILH